MLHSAVYSTYDVQYTILRYIIWGQCASSAQRCTPMQHVQCSTVQYTQYSNGDLKRKMLLNPSPAKCVQSQCVSVYQDMCQQVLASASSYVEGLSLPQNPCDYSLMNGLSPKGRTPLMLAAAGGYIWIIKYLLFARAGIMKKGLQAGLKVAWRAPTAHCATLRIALGARKAA